MLDITNNNQVGVINAHQLPKNQDKHNAYLLTRLNEALERCFDDFDLCSGNLHQLIPTSRATFHRKLNEETGLCASAYLKIFRVRRSLDMLIQTKYNITDIAFAVGMSCSTYTRAFKDLFGECPNNFRRKHVKAD